MEKDSYNAAMNTNRVTIIILNPNSNQNPNHDPNTKM